MSTLPRISGEIVPAMDGACQSLGIFNQNLSDEEIVNRIGNALIPHSCICVHKGIHRFVCFPHPDLEDSTEEDKKICRVIELSPSFSQRIFNAVALFFQESVTPLLGMALLGALGSSDQEHKNELFNCFRRNFSFEIFATLDGTNEIEFACDHGTGNAS